MKIFASRFHANGLRRIALTAVLISGIASIIGSGGGSDNPFERGCQFPNPGPGSCELTVQSPHDVAVTEGQDAVFEVVVGSVSFNPVSVQWESCPSGIDTANCLWTDLQGETGFSLVVRQAPLEQNGSHYRAVVTAPYSARATSDPARLTVLVPAAPTISVLPASTTVAEGQSATFTVTATGTALQYQWERSDDVSSPFSPIPGAESASYTLTNARFAIAPAGDNGARFRVVASNSGGSVTSDPPAVLSVTPALRAPVITQDPHSLAVTDGATASFTVAAMGTQPLAYQWRKNGTSVGTSASTLSFTATLADNGALIDVTVSNSTGSANSAVATLTVSRATIAPTITTQPQDAVVGVGATATFAVVASGTNLAYQWQRSNDGGASFTAAPGVNDQPTYELAGVSLADMGARFRVVVSNGAGSVTSNAAALAVAAFAAAGVAAGNGCSFSFKATGEAFAWGSDQFECLGNGAGTTRSYSPVHVTGLSDAVKLAAGSYGYHVLAIRANGEVWGWGYNNAGQLGDGTVTVQPVPVRMTTAESGNPPVSNAIAVAGGSNHSLILRSDGTVLAAGFNLNGQLGDSSTSNRNRAVAVVGLTGITAVSAGDRFSMALRNDGTVWTWGANNFGQLGDGTTNFRSLTPVRVTGLADVVAIAAGLSFAFALDRNGDVWAWGQNDAGQLGDGSGLPQRNVPGKVAISGVAAITAGYKYALAVLAGDGSIRAWGQNASGQLGVGDQVNRPTPTAVAGLPRVTSIAAGIATTLATDSVGNVWAWGSNLVGELGLGVTTLRFTTPQQLPGLP